MNKKKILYVDMDGTLVDFQSGIARTDKEILDRYKGHFDDIPGIFAKMDPVPGAVDAFQFLARHFDIYILSTSPWNNPTAWHDKLQWVKKYLKEPATKRLILSHHKNLNKGDYLIDDRDKHGVTEFEGEHIHFGQNGFETWDQVVRYLCEKENIDCTNYFQHA